MTDFTKLIYTTQANSLKNVQTSTVSVTISSGSQGSGTQQSFSGSTSLASTGAEFSQMLLHQDNFASPTAGSLDSTSEYLYFTGAIQLLVPATVPTVGPNDEVPAKVYSDISGGDINVTIYVANPYPDTITRAETTITLHYFAFLPFQT